MDVNSSAPIERSSTVQLNVGRLPMDWRRYLHIIQTALSTWFLEMYVNTAAIPIFIYGVYLSIKNKQWRSIYSGFWIMWILSFVIMFITFIDKFEHHGYYLTSASILAALGSTYGAIKMQEYKFGKKLNRNELLQEVPGLSEKWKLGLLFKQDGQIDNRRLLMRALEKACFELGVHFQEGVEVVEIMKDLNKFNGVKIKDINGNISD